MDISLYFEALDYRNDDFSTGKWGKKVQFHNEQEYPSLEKVDIVIIGVEEDRYTYNNEGCAKAPDVVRKYLYDLYCYNDNIRLADLGNIKQGNSVQDTYFAISNVVFELVKKGVVPVIIGGSQDLTYANYKAYENLEQVVNLVTIDNRFDIGGDANSELNSSNYLNGILLHQPNYLFNYSNIGYQTYFVEPDVLNLMDQLCFDSLRLGKIRSDIKTVEPLVRNADILSFDVGAIKASEAPGNRNATPNGLLSDECCQITRYAGMSDKLTSIGFYELNPEIDNGQTAHLVAQMIWYFIDGFMNRKNDFPSDKEKNYLKYRVNISEEEEDIVFFKSLKTDRWWINVPYPVSKGNRYKRHQMVPCSYVDYLEACEDQMPDLWLKTYRKFL